MNMGDQNVSTTPQQNILVAKALCNTIEPMLAEDHAATPITTRIKAMVMVAAIQHHQEGDRALSISRPTAIRQPSGWDRRQGRQPGDKEANLETWTLAAPSTTTATHATLSANSDANGTRRSNTSATMTASAPASSTINSATMIDATNVLHHDPLLHARAKNCSASTASVLSPFGYDKPTG